MDPFNTKTKPTTNKKPSQNFIEALKDGGDQPAAPAENFNFEEFLKLREKQIRHQEQARFEAFRREEKIVFSREKQRVKIEIQTLQTEIKKLAQESVGLVAEVEKAAFQAVVDPGVYHQNFFERLLSLIKLARKKIAESKTWLGLHNQRSQQRAYYWGQVKSSGTSFMLSGERTVSTQAG
ncbi:MAG: hypothetical protein UX85_C0003G0012 [Candidatus Beckwithbacteria bacterium GW2011_GWB1_47_15]|uniref:DUF5660 domain-containing protein n=1 Tax=Candidatus Beckwithbacteria bacterium GW2011_GWB1_47_15 TaxID=1618371 RepID=A0A0G1U4U5_9BACT|nr:MAG: hypothetical protein UY43_C0001G0454 [Candidatus Beckwithbacteria bacterium GW2011_GWC1_49_16]KKU34938.1 MAG: hypothetical protein UX50_C0008G0014 [Candidatus Beckwithbacteria bacterium GW2011_GWA1_46_30]KKU61353.1 MAG: hypothetical protein UX85_C0003G0012 [Candidatus Beckwithbacteria bacterium GW2011_GWB1_47_15]KKU71376.1 MAG: hypothetical protein UX97_C0007G0014 [Candidatus Beckwithbacteria bacterium GW2011_GWA2_47_25]OGD48708.1 MAG: hypothetical protein A2877_03475 [Candidatus Beckwi